MQIEQGLLIRNVRLLEPHDMEFRAMEKFHNLCVPVLVACAARDQCGQAVGVESARLEGGCHKIGGGADVDSGDPRGWVVSQ